MSKNNDVKKKENLAKVFLDKHPKKRLEETEFSNSIHD